VPGPWSQADLDFHGANLASMLTNNAGFNCNATRVIVQHASWEQRRALLESTRKVFAAAPAAFAYYPGAESRYQSFLTAHPQAEPLGEPGEGALPWLLIEDLDPARANEICFTTEAFCSVTSEVGLDAASTVDYIRRARRVRQRHAVGTLNAGIIVHPKSLADPAVAAAVEQGDRRSPLSAAVVLNHWPALSYALGDDHLGAFPGQRRLRHPLRHGGRAQPAPLRQAAKRAWCADRSACFRSRRGSRCTGRRTSSAREAAALRGEAVVRQTARRRRRRHAPLGVRCKSS
jgi:hypothetical protein